MRIHILGICGTFMGGIALLARELGHEVTGADLNIYPPMSTQLEAAGIALCNGYDPAAMQPVPDLVVIGNAMSRGNPSVEYVLDRGLRYTSGPAFLADYLLQDRWVLAVAGTHGKTTTSSMLAWILEYAGLAPGFLIGGVPLNFGASARSGKLPFFVVEADEYDSAFFDKRSKFIHYHPRTLVINNIEFDHADIFPDIAAIQRQFHHLVRTVPGGGLIIAPGEDEHVKRTLEMGVWTPVERFGSASDNVWHASEVSPDGSQFTVMAAGQPAGTVTWSQLGRHNVHNALAALAAARHAGVPATQGVQALNQFAGAKRRLEVRGTVRGVTVYDDFAHHPTAIRTTLEGLRHKIGRQRIIAIMEPRSNTMRAGVHKDTLAPSFDQADLVVFYAPDDLGWDLAGVAAPLGTRAVLFSDIASIINHIVTIARADDHVLIMSNGGFGNIHQRLLAALTQTAEH